MTPERTGKYKLNETCDWCGAKDAREITIQTNGVKTKRYAITATACSKCERRLITDDSND